MNHLASRVQTSVAAILLCCAANAQANDPKSVKVDIQQQSVLGALKELGEQTGLQLLMRVDSVSTDDIVVQPVAGQLSLKAALDKLLANTGLTYEFINDRTVRISRSESRPTSSLQQAPIQAYRVADLAVAATDTGGGGRAEPTASSSRADTANGQLEQVVVTAQKREERLQDVPISITAITGQMLERTGAKDINDFVRSVPNLMFQPTQVGSSSVSIRGIASLVGAPTVGVYIDETPVQMYQRAGFASNANPKVFDLDRIEVLRGPQGTLYGGSSMGGTIRYITRQPSLTAFSARAVTEGSSMTGGDPSWEAGFAAGGPIVENTAGYRGSVYYRKDGGFIDNVDRTTGATLHKNVNSSDTLALRGAITTKLGESFEATLSGFYQRIERDDLPVYERPLGPFAQGFQVAQPGRDRFVLPSLKITGELGSISITSITSTFERKDLQITDYSSLVPEFTLTPDFVGVEEPGGAPHYSTNTQHNFSQEIRIASQDEENARVSWVVGAFYQRAKLRFDEKLVEPGLDALYTSLLGLTEEEVLGLPLLPGNVSYLGRERTDEEQVAGFGELNFKLNPKLELVAGVRVSELRTTTQVAADGPLNGGPTPDDAAAPRRQKETPVTPRLGINFRPTADNLLYATASRGFRSGGGNNPVPTDICGGELNSLGLVNAPVTYGSDKTQNYEVGYKASLAEQRVNLSAAAFRIDWKDIQQNVFFPTCGFSFIGNLGKARSQGFELDVQAQPARGLFLNASAGYTDAKLRETLSLGAGETVVNKGDRIPFTPKWTAAAGVEQRFPIAANTAYLRADYEYRGGLTRTQKAVDVAADPFLYEQKSYNYVSARTGVEFGKWDVALFVENLLNDRPVLSREAALMPITQLRVREATLQPRTVGIMLSATF